MNWNPIWEQIFKTKEWGKYPPEELIRFIAKNFYLVEKRSKIKILDIGCGTGACMWYLARENFSSYGIDASPTAIKIAKKRFKEDGLKGNFVIGTVDLLPWPNNTFDAVIDIGCLTCNSEKETKKIIKEIHRVLKPGGKHFSLTPGNGSWGQKTGVKIDKTTVTDIKIGPFAGVGTVRFVSKDNLKKLYSDFKNIEIEYTMHTLHNDQKKVWHLQLSCMK